MRSFDDTHVLVQALQERPVLAEQFTPAEWKFWSEEIRQYTILQSPLAYAQHCRDDFMAPAHVQLISDTIRQMVDRELLRADGRPYTKLMVNMPPRHGKSELITRAAPAWYLTRYPDRRVIVTGYEADFAADFGADARRYITDYGKEFGVAVDPTTASKSNWGLDGRLGGMRTAGAGGPITGKGGHFIVIDDPVKNAEEADSPTIRENHWKWWQSTVSSRQEPGCVIVCVMTRWHEDDLGGRLLAHDPDNWYVLSLPALAGEDDPLGRAPGEALWRERYDEDWLQEQCETVGPRVWSALYQQSPSIEGGNVFRADKFRYFSAENTMDGRVFYLHAQNGPARQVHEDDCKLFYTLDLAATTKNRSDWTVAAVFLQTPAKELLLIDLIRVRIEAAEHEQFVDRLRAKWPGGWIGVEKATFGMVLIQMLQRRGLPVRELTPDKDKETRALPAATLIDQDRIYFLRGASWLHEFEAELLHFPYGTHDDQVDCLAYAARYLADSVRPPRRDAPPPLTKLDAHFENFGKTKRKMQRRVQAGVLGSNW